jgi:hypothetical protein
MPANLPQDIGNQVIDAIGWQHDLGDLQEGSTEAKIILRSYSQCLRQLLRAAHWDFARKEAPLVLQADATGQTPGVGTIVPGAFAYSYQYPADCMKVRFIPWTGQFQNTPVPSGNIVPPNSTSPTIATLNTQPLGIRQRPARYLIAVDPNYPPPAGAQTWDVQGASPQGRSVICTNVMQAHVVYTALMNYPSNWDPLFRAAFVAFLASEVALPIWASKDRKFGLEIRGQQLALAKVKIMEARATNGNETWASADLSVDWMRARNVGTGVGHRYGYESGPGMLYGGLDDCCGVGNTGAY